jgi:exoribonuclease R
MVVSMTIDGDGAVSSSAIYRAEVVNHAKLAYDSVAAWLDIRSRPIHDSGRRRSRHAVAASSPKRSSPGTAAFTIVS